MIPSGRSHDSLCNTQLVFPHLVYVCCCGNDCLHAILFSVCDCTVRFTAVYSSSCCNFLLLDCNLSGYTINSIKYSCHLFLLVSGHFINTITIIILQSPLFLSLSSSSSSSIILTNNTRPNPVAGRSSVASTKDTTLIGRISDVVRPERGTDFFA
jgi:hypothetical protein